MLQRHKNALNRLQNDCEAVEGHNIECFATKLLDLAADFYVENGIKDRCFAYLVATDQLTKFYETSTEEVAQMIENKRQDTTK